jgi:D-cysteine desulfhydrase
VGTALGAALYGIAPSVLAMAVCDDARYFERKIEADLTEARPLLESAPSAAPYTVIDDFKGPAYGVASEAQLRFIVEVARACGLVVDPVYTGKALFGLAQLPSKPPRALFLHTGGLPGLLAQGDALAPLTQARVLDMW